MRNIVLIPMLSVFWLSLIAFCILYLSVTQQYYRGFGPKIRYVGLDSLECTILCDDPPFQQPFSILILLHFMIHFFSAVCVHPNLNICFLSVLQQSVDLLVNPLSGHEGYRVVIWVECLFHICTFSVPLMIISIFQFWFWIWGWLSRFSQPIWWWITCLEPLLEIHFLFHQTLSHCLLHTDSRHDAME